MFCSIQLVIELIIFSVEFVCSFQSVNILLFFFICQSFNFIVFLSFHFILFVYQTIDFIVLLGGLFWKLIIQTFDMFFVLIDLFLLIKKTSLVLLIVFLSIPHQLCDIRVHCYDIFNLLFRLQFLSRHIVISLPFFKLEINLADQTL